MIFSKTILFLLFVALHSLWAVAPSLIEANCTPNFGSIVASTTTNIVLQFNAPVDAVDPLKSIKVHNITTPSVQNFAIPDLTNLTAWNANKDILTLNVSLVAGEQYWVEIEAGAFLDATLPTPLPNVAYSNPATWSFTVNADPIIDSQSTGYFFLTQNTSPTISFGITDEAALLTSGFNITQTPAASVTINSTSVNSANIDLNITPTSLGVVSFSMTYTDPLLATSANVNYNYEVTANPTFSIVAVDENTQPSGTTALSVEFDRNITLAIAAASDYQVCESSPSITCVGASSVAIDALNPRLLRLTFAALSTAQNYYYSIPSHVKDASGAAFAVAADISKTFTINSVPTFTTFSISASTAASTITLTDVDDVESGSLSLKHLQYKVGGGAWADETNSSCYTNPITSDGSNQDVTLNTNSTCFASTFKDVKKELVVFQFYLYDGTDSVQVTTSTSTLTIDHEALTFDFANSIPVHSSTVSAPTALSLRFNKAPTITQNNSLFLFQENGVTDVLVCELSTGEGSVISTDYSYALNATHCPGLSFAYGKTYYVSTVASTFQDTVVYTSSAISANAYQFTIGYPAPEISAVSLAQSTTAAKMIDVAYCAKELDPALALSPNLLQFSETSGGPWTAVSPLPSPYAVVKKNTTTCGVLDSTRHQINVSNAVTYSAWQNLVKDFYLNLSIQNGSLVSSNVEEARLSLDLKSPALDASLFSPTNASTTVNPLTTTQLHFAYDEDITPIVGKKLRLYKNNSGVSTAVDSVEVDDVSKVVTVFAIGKDTVKWTLTSTLEYDTEYWVEIEDAFEDVFKNTNVALSANPWASAATEWQFKTIGNTLPKLVWNNGGTVTDGLGTSAFAQETDGSGEVKVTLNIVDPEQATVSIDSIRIGEGTTWNLLTGTAITAGLYGVANDTSKSALPLTNTVSFSIFSKLITAATAIATADTNLQVKVYLNDGVGTDSITSSVFRIDNKAPEFSSFSPANAATPLITPTTKLLFTASESVTEKLPKVVLYSWNNPTLTGVDSIAASSLSEISTDRYEWSLTATMAYNTQFVVHIRDGAFEDDFGNTNIGYQTNLWVTGSQGWRFATKANTAPKITWDDGGTTRDSLAAAQILQKTNGSGKIDVKFDVSDPEQSTFRIDSIVIGNGTDWVALTSGTTEHLNLSTDLNTSTEVDFNIKSKDIDLGTLSLDTVEVSNLQLRVYLTDGISDTLIASELFSLDNKAPKVSLQWPSHNATGINRSSFRPILRFHENIFPEGGGNPGIVELYKKSDGHRKKEWKQNDINYVSGSLTTDSVTFDAAANTLEANTFYQLRIKANEIEDAFGNLFTGTTASNWEFKTSNVVPELGWSSEQSTISATANTSITAQSTTTRGLIDVSVRIKESDADSVQLYDFSWSKGSVDCETTTANTILASHAALSGSFTSAVAEGFNDWAHTYSFSWNTLDVAYNFNDSLLNNLNLCFRVIDNATGISDWITYEDVSLDLKAPVVTGYSPADGATDASEDTALELTFDEEIFIPSGYVAADTFMIFATGTPDTLADTFTTLTANAIGSTTWTWNRVLGKLLSKHDYHVQIDSAMVFDKYLNAYKGVSNKTDWNFKTENWIPASKRPKTLIIDEGDVVSVTSATDTSSLINSLTDPDNDVLSVIIDKAPTRTSNFVPNANGTYSWTDNGKSNGRLVQQDTLVYRITDLSSNTTATADTSAADTLFIQINPINDRPTSANHVDTMSQFATKSWNFLHKDAGHLFPFYDEDTTGQGVLTYKVDSLTQIKVAHGFRLGKSKLLCSSVNMVVGDFCDIDNVSVQTKVMGAYGAVLKDSIQLLVKDGANDTNSWSDIPVWWKLVIDSGAVPTASDTGLVITEDSIHFMQPENMNYVDVDGHLFKKWKVVTLPDAAKGKLYCDGTEKILANLADACDDDDLYYIPKADTNQYSQDLGLSSPNSANQYDSFQVQLLDETGKESATKTVYFNVNAVNDIPEFIPYTGATGDTISILEDAHTTTATAKQINITGVYPADLAARTMPDEINQNITFEYNFIDVGTVGRMNQTEAEFPNASDVFEPISGKLIQSSYTKATHTLEVSFKTKANANGFFAIEYWVKDNGGTSYGGVDTSLVDTLFIEVKPVNDKPKFTLNTTVIPSTLSVDEDSCNDTPTCTGRKYISADIQNTFAVHSVVGGSLPLDEVANQALQGFSIASNGAVSPTTFTSLFDSQPSIVKDGADYKLEFTLAENANGSQSWCIRALDDGGNADTGIDSTDASCFTIEVESVNDKPVFTTEAIAEPLVDSVSYSANKDTLRLLEDHGLYTQTTFLKDVFAVDTSSTALDEKTRPLETSAIIAYIDQSAGNINNDTFWTTAANIFSTAPTITQRAAPDTTEYSLSFETKPHVNGLVGLVYRVQDKEGTLRGGINVSRMDTLWIKIVAVNDAPTYASPIGDQILAEDGCLVAATCTAPATVIDWYNALHWKGGPAGALDEEDSQPVQSIVMSTSDSVTYLNVAPTTKSPFTSLFIASPDVAYTNGSGSKDLTWTLQEDANGEQEWCMTFFDGNGTASKGVDSLRQCFDIKVNPVNDKPVFTLNTAQLVNDTLYVVEDSNNVAAANTWSFAGFAKGIATAKATALDEQLGVTPQGDSLFSFALDTFSLSINEYGSKVSSIAIHKVSGDLSFVLKGHANGIDSIEVSIGDDVVHGVNDDSTSVTKTFYLSVRPRNDKPEFAFKDSTSTVTDTTHLRNDTLFVMEDGFRVQGTTPNANYSFRVIDSLRAAPSEAIDELAPAGSNIQSFNGFTMTAITTADLFAVTPSLNVEGFPNYAGRLDFTLKANANGCQAYEARVQDNGLSLDGISANTYSKKDTLTICVEALNDKPSFVKVDPVSLWEDDSLLTHNGPDTVSFIQSESSGDVDSGFLTGKEYRMITDLTSSSILTISKLLPNGKLIYQLTQDANGRDSIQVALYDGGEDYDGTLHEGDYGVSDTTWIYIDVKPLDDAPFFAKTSIADIVNTRKNTLLADTLRVTENESAKAIFTKAFVDSFAVHEPDKDSILNFSVDIVEGHEFLQDVMSGVNDASWKFTYFINRNMSSLKQERQDGLMSDTASWNAIFDRLTYQSTSDAPAASKKLRITMHDEGSTTSNFLEIPILITQVNDLPVLLGLTDSVEFKEKEAIPVVLMSDPVINDPDNNSFDSLQIRIMGPEKSVSKRLNRAAFQLYKDSIFKAGDTLTLDGYAGSLSVDFSALASEGVLTLADPSCITPTGCVGVQTREWMEALRALRFSTTNTEISQKTRRFIEFSIKDHKVAGQTDATVWQADSTRYIVMVKLDPANDLPTFVGITDTIIYTEDRKNSNGTSPYILKFDTIKTATPQDIVVIQNNTQTVVQTTNVFLDSLFDGDYNGTTGHDSIVEAWVRLENYSTENDSIWFTSPSCNSLSPVANPLKGSWFFSGRFTPVTYSECLKSIHYKNSSANPDTSVRALTFLARDTLEFGREYTFYIKNENVNDTGSFVDPTKYYIHENMPLDSVFYIREVVNADGSIDSVFVYGLNFKDPDNSYSEMDFSFQAGKNDSLVMDTIKPGFLQLKEGVLLDYDTRFKETNSADSVYFIVPVASTEPLYKATTTDTVLHDYTNIKIYILDDTTEVSGIVFKSATWGDSIVYSNSIYTNADTITVAWDKDYLLDHDYVVLLDSVMDTVVIDSSLDPSKNIWAYDSIYVFKNSVIPLITLNETRENQSIDSLNRTIVHIDSLQDSIQLKVEYHDRTNAIREDVIWVQEDLWEHGLNSKEITYGDIYGNVGTYTVWVNYDTIAPVIEIVSPTGILTKAQNTVDVVWMADSIVQKTRLVEKVEEGFTTIIRDTSDLAGNWAADTIVLEVRFPQEIDVTIGPSLVHESDGWASYVSDVWNRSAETEENFSIRLQNPADTSYKELLWANGDETFSSTQEEWIQVDSTRGFVLNFAAPMPLNGGLDRFGELRDGACSSDPSKGSWDVYFESLLIHIYDNSGLFLNTFNATPSEPYVLTGLVPQDDSGLIYLQAEMSPELLSEAGRKVATGAYIFNGAIRLRAVQSDCGNKTGNSLLSTTKRAEFVLRLGYRRK